MCPTLKHFFHFLYMVCGEQPHPQHLKEMIVDYRRNKPDIQPIYMNGESGQRVSDLRFLGMHIKQDLTWIINTKALMKKAQQRLFPKDPQEEQSSGEKADDLLSLHH